MVFHYGRLTRRGGLDPRTLTYAVLDLETTGLNPKRGARVCEIAVVRMRGDGTVLDEYSTLVNPGSSIRNSAFHGITDTWVKTAPSFDQVAGDLLAYLDGAIVVGHKLDFEEKFLAAEFARLGVPLTGIPGLCTLVAARYQLDRYGYRLAHLHHLLTGRWPTAEHSALGDARSLAAVLTELINAAPQPLHWDGPTPAPLPQLPRTRIIAPRAAALRKGSEGWLATLTARLPLMVDSPPPRSEALDDYQAMLAHALSDGRVVGEEAEQLALLASRAGLTQETARGVHGEFLLRARDRAEADGVVTAAELRELQRAAKNLAVSHLISDLEEAAAAEKARRNGPLKGWRILPVGEGKELTDVMDYAVDHGAKVAANVTKTVRLVIAPDGVETTKTAQARERGVPILTPKEAWTLLSAEVEQKQRGAALVADTRAGDVAARIAAEQAHEQAGETTNEWHQFWRPRELTDAEYRVKFVDRFADETAPVFTSSKTTQNGGCAGAILLLATLAGAAGTVPGLVG
ncbi:exonuclease [Thermobifida fusca YX]|jgi:DNA polymerase-3 subunit epsilon|uniref:Exonuclease n=3 Tax=Thermobifida fusca TaxID=2021 RepID=A0A9P2TBN0_THEFU|nr:MULTISPECIES: exonuclease domain-containing protein [Thermobifida]AAZ54752.1 exonuclease [Thermobifida fusca YX]EOR72264.1 exonuclease [Thermobifida fusca TM51]MBO2529389.1 DNA polymerase III subunit epsilon [Thermobifida sp.]PPS96487.1 exonuclease [Thermobifida fusca]PZN64507.1 MAG: DNA polymerase III subunit epsilon [Thermobifida fusca]